MRFRPKNCLRNSLIILIVFGTFKIRWRQSAKLEVAVEERDSITQPNIQKTEAYSAVLHSTQLHSSRPPPSAKLQSMQIPSSLPNSTATLLEKPKFLILIYTRFWQKVKEVGEYRSDCILDQTSRTQCPLDRFEMTYDKQRFLQSDLVIFHAAGGNMPSVDHLKSLSKNRPAKQRWVYQTMEGPLVTPDPAPLNGLFNATWTYRGDSEFSAAYSAYVPLFPEEAADRMKTMIDYSQGKTKLVAWLVSNCGSQLRMAFVRELMKYINVDVYGSCSSAFGQRLSCSKSGEKDCLKHYKFYLSFENALCKDYITEKYWDHLGKYLLLFFKSTISTYFMRHKIILVSKVTKAKHH